VQKKIVIAGASGLVGGAAVRLFGARGDWDVVAISRRRTLGAPASVQHIAVDLSDQTACARVLGAISGVTHIIYAALTEKLEDIYGGWSDPIQIRKNVAMLHNLFEPLAGASRDLRHVSLVHGAKAYGCHLPQLKVPIPMRESLPRVPHANFYHEQEDYLTARQKGCDWTWTVFRPVMIAGVGTGSNMNPFLTLPLFAALRREAGLDLPRPDGMSLVADATDADLIAEALTWAADAAEARNEIFNISNGDVFALHEAFPVVADALGMRLGAPQRFDIIQEIRRMAGLWSDMVQRYELDAPRDVNALFGGSMDMGGGWSAEAPEGNPLRWGVLSTIKLRQAGFSRCIDTLEMVRKYVRRYQELRILPPNIPIGDD